MVGEAVAHHETWVTGGTPEVHEATFGEHVDAVALFEGVFINLRLDVELLDSLKSLELIDLNLIIEVTDITNDGLILHLFHVLGADNVEVSGGGHIDVTPAKGVFNGEDTEAFHGSLQSTNWIDLGHNNLGTLGAKSLGTPLADITVSTNNPDLTGDHHIGGTLDPINEGLTATVQVVELRLGHRVIHVDRGEEKLPVPLHLIEAVNAGCGLLGDSFQLGNPSVKNAGLLGMNVFEKSFDHGFLGRRSRLVDPIGSILELVSLVDEESGITTIIDNQLGTKRKASIRIGELQRLPGAPPVFFESLALPGKDRISGLRHGSGGVILGGKNVTGTPANISTNFTESLHEDCGLDGHVKRPHHAHTIERLAGAILFASGHEAGHFMLGNIEFFATETGEADIFDFII